MKILDCKKSKRHIVLPIFYNVDPTEVEEVEEQTGSFREAFAKHETQFIIHQEYGKGAYMEGSSC